MAKFLMDYCLNHRRESCDNRVKNIRNLEKICDCNYMPTIPDKNAQLELDHICEKCAFAIFLIERTCPVCNKVDLKWGSPKKVTLSSKLGPIIAFHYICSNCGRDLYSKDVLSNWIM